MPSGHTASSVHSMWPRSCMRCSSGAPKARNRRPIRNPKARKRTILGDPHVALATRVPSARDVRIVRESGVFEFRANFFGGKTRVFKTYTGHGAPSLFSPVSSAGPGRKRSVGHASHVSVCKAVAKQWKSLLKSASPLNNATISLTSASLLTVRARGRDLLVVVAVAGPHGVALLARHFLHALQNLGVIIETT